MGRGWARRKSSSAPSRAVFAAAVDRLKAFYVRYSDEQPRFFAEALGAIGNIQLEEIEIGERGGSRSYGSEPSKGAKVPVEAFAMGEGQAMRGTFVNS